jgi:hypothetical protein
MSEPKKAKLWVTAASALVVAATPGVYSAWEAAKAKWTQRQEQKLRDAQEGDLQKAVKAHTEAIEAIRQSMVTHKDLVDLVLKLRAPHHRRRPDPQNAALQAELGRLRQEASAGAKARDKAVQALRKLPKLKAAPEVRQAINAEL